MTFAMLRDIAKNINVFFSIMANEATDNNSNEQLDVCIRWVDNNFEAHEDFIGILAVEKIKSDTLGTILKDILTRLNIPLSKYRCQCYNMACSMKRIKRGVAKQIQSESPLAFFTHCYGYALSLALNDVIKEDELL